MKKTFMLLLFQMAVKFVLFVEIYDIKMVQIKLSQLVCVKFGSNHEFRTRQFADSRKLGVFKKTVGKKTKQLKWNHTHKGFAAI